ISLKEEKEIQNRYKTILKSDVALFIQELTLVYNSNEEIVNGLSALMKKLIDDKDPISHAKEVVSNFERYTKGAVATIYQLKDGIFVPVASTQGSGITITPQDRVYAYLKSGKVFKGVFFKQGFSVEGRYYPILKRGLVKGAIFVGVDLRELLHNFKTTLKKVKIGKSGYIYVMDLTTKRFVFHPERQGENIYSLKDITGKSIVQKMLIHRKGIMEYTVSRNGKEETLLCAYQYFAPYKWLVVATIRSSEVSAAINKLRFMLIGLNFIAAIIVGIVVFLVTKNSLKTIPVIATTLEKLAEGDLTQKFNFSNKDIRRKDEIGMLISSILKLDSFIKDSFKGIKRSINSVKTVINVLEDNIVHVKEKADTQHALTNQLAAASEEMTATIADIAKNATTSAELATKSAKVAEEGKEKAENAEQTIYTTNQATQQLKGTIDHLSASVEEIGGIVGLIKDIADQINLLALNATIEAARAGEHGKGFAVVAEEIRKLAERTIKASDEIAEKIIAVQKVSNETLTQMDITAKEVEGAIAALQTVKDALLKIVEHSNQVKDAISHIAAATEEQSITSEEINKHVEEAAKLASEIKETTFEVDDAVGSLEKVVEDLVKTVEKVRL
ncbi:MAG: methyl-accepting chemotaxis protein, partial [Thermodesulfobacteria bacterium]|nr:methyl-accepting chemotaxis protein [Thermodesulfobacteriota bacterium]